MSTLNEKGGVVKTFLARFAQYRAEKGVVDTCKHGKPSKEDNSLRNT